MKKKIIALILSVSAMLTAALPIQAKLLEDSPYWSNLDDSEADDLLLPLNDNYQDSFIFVYYRESCGFSQVMLPLIEYYAKLNDLQVCGLDDDVSAFKAWSEFVKDSYIGFPLIIVYNADRDKFYAEHSIRSEEAFLRFMSDARYDLNTANEIKLKIGSKKMACSYGTEQMDVPACIINDRTMIPLRAVAEAIGARIKWNEANRVIRISRSNQSEIWMTVDSNHMQKGQSMIPLDAPPKIVDGRTLVPVRAITEAFGYNVDWDQATQTVTIYVQ